MQPSNQEPRTYPLDAEHIGVRLAVPFIALFACIGTYWLGLQLVGDKSMEMVGAVAAAIAVALAAAWLAERLIKRYWPSGRTLTLDAGALTLREREGYPTTLHWEGHINILTWRFTIPPRRGRVPKGWYCMACRLLQDEEEIIVYTFMPPDRAEDLDAFPAFTYLLPAKEREKSDWLRSGTQARLYAAERDRWAVGAEMNIGDFIDLVHVLAARIEGWPAGSQKASSHAEKLSVERPPSKGDDTPIIL